MLFCVGLVLGFVSLGGCLECGFSCLGLVVVLLVFFALLALVIFFRSCEWVMCLGGCYRLEYSCSVGIRSTFN